MKKILLFIFLGFVSYINAQCPEGTTQIIYESGGTTPTGWTVEDQRASYWLLDGNPSTIVQMSSIDVSSYTSITVSMSVATFGSGTANPAQVEYSTDGGATFTSAGITNTPSKSSYIDGGDITFSVPANTTQLQIRLSNTSTSGRGVRIRDFYICGSNSSSCTATLVSGTATCDASTAGTDTYSATFTYTHGGSGAALIVNSNVGTPNVSTISADGTITVTGISEGTAVNLTVSGGDNSCNLTAIVSSPTCEPVTGGSTGTFTTLSQFVNPCGGDSGNEFIVAETSGGTVNIGDLAFASAQNGDNVNFYWRGTNVASNSYDIVGFSSSTYENCGLSNNECYYFAYPSVPSDKTVIDQRINELNTVAGCIVFLSVPTNDEIPSDSKVVVLLGAFHCGFDNVATNLNFSNHCSGVTATTQYYVVIGKGDGGGGSSAPCTNTNSGYFSNSVSRTSYSMVFNGTGANTQSSSYTLTQQSYTPTSVSSGNAGVATPGENLTATWTDDQGCVPAATVLARNLPVTLTSFEAVAEGGEVDLTWTTATEINNDYFAVQHSVDGVHFEDIATVYGNGNSTETITYEYTHTTPASGVNYYRLKQVDFDGGYEYHGVETVVVAEAGEITIYPSVITDEVYVNAPSYKNGKVVVFDAVGQVVLTQTLTRSMSLVDLTTGTYIIKVIADGAIATEKIVKL